MENARRTNITILTVAAGRGTMPVRLDGIDPHAGHIQTQALWR